MPPIEAQTSVWHFAANTSICADDSASCHVSSKTVTFLQASLSQGNYRFAFVCLAFKVFADVCVCACV